MASSLFSFGDVKNHPSRSGFDVGARRLFTAKAGQLLPVYWDLLLPGTKVNLKDIHFTRTMPVNTAAFTRIKEYIDWYFVPLRLINKNLPPALVNMVDQSNIASSLVLPKEVTTYIPYFSGKNITSIFDIFYQGSSGATKLDVCGYERAAQSVRLLRYLRYGNLFFNKAPVSESLPSANYGYSGVASFRVDAAFDLNYNVLPLAAYQKIYCDHYRFEQWEKAQPYTYNFDYYSGQDILSPYLASSAANTLMSQDNIFTLRYCNYPKDMFMGLLPSSQLGDVAIVNIVGSSNVVVSSAGGKVQGVVNSNQTVDLLNTVPFQPGTPRDLLAVFDGAFSTARFDILAFRVAQATQKYREVAQCAGQGYKEQLEAHWNVKLSNALSDHCQYVGGSSSQIAISEVVNQSVAGDVQADIKGKGIGSGSGSESFSTNEHGILMAMYHAVPILDYALTGPDLRLLSTLATDLPQSEFDSLGLESIPAFSLINDKYSANIMNDGSFSVDSLLGYGSRYLSYKTQVDTVDGAFLTTLTSWVTPLKTDRFLEKLYVAGSGFSLNYEFFKVNPNVLNPIFVQPCDSTVDTDQFLVQAYFDVKKVQNLDYNGMPY